MYDVKQFDPAEWSSPPLEARLIDKAGFGRVIMGRGAVNQKGPEAAFLAALHALRAAGRKPPVNLVLVAKARKKSARRTSTKSCARPDSCRAEKRCKAFSFHPLRRTRTGNVTFNLGAKGIIECELIASGEKWGRGPRATFTRASRPWSIQPVVAPGRALRPWSPPTATRRRSTAGSRTCAR